jgi:pyrroline-5-carboxylate reductase
MLRDQGRGVSEPLETPALPAKVALIGAGKMGLALLKGWAARGLSGDGVVVVEPDPHPELAQLCSERGFILNGSYQQGVHPEALVLAIKPQMLDTVAPSIAGFLGEDTVVVSILAGKRVADISTRLAGAQAIVRAMPNTAAAVGRGVTGAFASAAISERQRLAAHALLAAVGSVEWVEREEFIDSVTAVSGSGPAYVFYFVEALASAGVGAGLPPDLAARIARETVVGAGELLSRSPELSPETLRQHVTSPGGTTAAALEVLMAGDGLAPLIERAVAAARRRAGELSG